MNTEHHADATRQKILDIAAEEIHVHGFQACSTSEIIKKAGISKGALYHHFTNKLELGYAVFDEVFAPKLIGLWKPVLKGNNPIQNMSQLFQEILSWTDCKMLTKGCPLNNLAQEMSPIDEGFRLRIGKVFNAWELSLTKALIRGQASGTVKQEVNPKRAALFIMASIEGAQGLAKNSQDTKVFSEGIYGLIDYLQMLKAT